MFQQNFIYINKGLAWLHHKTALSWPLFFSEEDTKINKCAQDSGLLCHDSFPVGLFSGYWGCAHCGLVSEWFLFKRHSSTTKKFSKILLFLPSSQRMLYGTHLITEVIFLRMFFSVSFPYRPYSLFWTSCLSTPHAPTPRNTLSQQWISIRNRLPFNMPHVRQEQIRAMLFGMNPGFATN